MSAILAIIKAIPTIGKWLDQLALAIFKLRASEMAKENREAIRKALNEQDQRHIEHVMGSAHAGRPTGLGDVVESLPGVLQDPNKKRD